jgi:hypothetical protein
MFIKNQKQSFDSNVVLPKSNLSVYLSMHSWALLPSLASFTSLLPASLFSPSSPQQLINATPSASIIRAAFLLHFPSHTAREQHFPCTPCTTNINLLPKMMKFIALINECDDWINSRTLISESGIHTKYTTIVLVRTLLFLLQCIYMIIVRNDTFHNLRNPNFNIFLSLTQKKNSHT